MSDGVGVRALVVALDDHAVAGRQVGLAQARGGDRPADELDRDRIAGARGRAHVAGDERVDVAGHEDDVLDLAIADVREQVLALLRVAVPAVEAEERAAQHPRRHDRHLVGQHLPGGLRAVELGLEPVHLARAEEGARLVVVGARRHAARVVARLVGAVLALVHDQQVDRAPELQAPVDAVALAGGRRVGHRLEEGLVGGRLALLGVVMAGAAGRRRARRRRSRPGPRGRPTASRSGSAAGTLRSDSSERYSEYLSR